MNADDIKQKLQCLDVELVNDFVLDLYLQYPELKAQIETLVLFNDPAALAKAILKRIQSISRGRKFIDYRLSASFARDLDAIVTDIERGLLEHSAKHAFDLMTKFLVTSNKVFERVDDSSGSIGDVYRDAVLLWLTTAKAYKDATPAGAKVNWLERVNQLYRENDYGVYDGLLPNSAILLSHDELSQLAWRYESELRQAMKTTTDNNRVNMAALDSSIAMGSIAVALKNPTLYERATLIDSPEPNDLQKKSIVQMYLKFNEVDAALRWLNTPWLARFEADRLKLLEDAFVQNADEDALKQTRYDVYQRDKSHSSYTRYLECLTDTEQQTARIEAITLAEQGDDLLLNIDMLLQLNEAETAQSLVLTHANEMENGFYGSLLELAKQFEKQACWLAATACYRSLLCDILKQARSKAYTHAARYYKKLANISEHIHDYSPLIEQVAFIAQLKQAHGRKNSFWRRV